MANKASTRRLTREELDQLPSMWRSPGFLATIVAVAAAFGAWSMLLPVVPLDVIRSGGSDEFAGSITGAFMAATVLTQIITPRLLRRFGYLPVMIIAAILLGLPAMAFLLGMKPALVLAISIIRGIGFGALTVAESALIAELVPLKFLGKATATLGLAVALAELVFLPFGLYVAEHINFGVVYVSGALVGLLAAVMCLAIPPVRPAASQTKAVADATVRTPTWRLVLVPAIGMCVSAMGFGAISTFLSPAIRETDPASGALLAGIALSAVGAAQMVFRYVAGSIADRRGMPGACTLPALAAGATGLAVIATGVAHHWSAWLLLIGAVLYGAGFGAMQNEALLAMFTRLPRHRVSDASALWNISFDSGTGLGSFALGFVAAAFAYSGAFYVSAGLILFGLVVTALDIFLGRHRISEHDNIKARLRQVSVARRVPRIRRGNK